jgi:hypothetical protein
VISDCEVSLEDVARRIQDVRVNDKPAPFTFVNCIVSYKGGPIPAKSRAFINCILRFEVPAVPPREGMLAMRQLTKEETQAPILLR